jgi:hypothetical protein
MAGTSDEERLKELGVDQKLTRGWGLLVSSSSISLSSLRR